MSGPSMTRAPLIGVLAAVLAACGTAPQPELVDEPHAPTTRATQRRPPREEPLDTSEVVGKGPFPASENPALRDPSLAIAAAPTDFRVLFRTSAGNFSVDCHRDWAPSGADRLYALVKIGFYDDVAFFRVVSSPQPFVAQFGIHGDPAVTAAWKDQRLPIDPVVQSNTRGTLTFAMAGKADTRTTQLFLNLTDNARLDAMGFAPVCAVADDGMDTVAKLVGVYGEKPTGTQGDIMSQGNPFLRERFPELDYIATARIVPIPGPAAPLGTAPIPSADLPPAPSASAPTPVAPAPSASAKTSPFDSQN